MKHLYARNTDSIGLLALPVLIFFILLSAPLPAQTAQRLEEMLDKSALNWEDAAIFTLEASNQAALSDPQEAFDFAQSRKWLPKKAQMGDPARLDGVALLLMRAFDLKGGIFYSIAKIPHYAYHECVYQGLIQGRTDPAMSVSGEDYLFILSRVLSAEDARRQARVDKINRQLAGLTDMRAEFGVEGIIIRVSNIRFSADSAVLPDSEKERLRELARILRGIPGNRIQVAGHTALAGSSEGRRQISLERAQSVASYLIELDARKADDITVQGFGGDRPIADNSTPEGMEMNRRVEITILDY